MAPKPSRKRKSETIEHEDHSTIVTTPTGSPVHKKMKITQPQKQALIDNLQLEITERARHLRAHYALQSTDLRSRIERRINRIPIALRKANMGDLVAKHLDASIAKDMPPLPTRSPQSSRPLPAAPTKKEASTATEANLPRAPAASTKGKKRCSSEVIVLSDKDGEPVVDAVSNPKNPKRAKTSANTTSKRAASRTVKTAPNNVLSPKSHNSRTLPRSPIKDTIAPNPTASYHSPSKLAYTGRPVSPFKSASPLKSAAGAATNAISASLQGMVEHAKRGAGNSSSNLRRIASKDNSAPSSSTVAANAKGKMAPPPRPRTATAAQHEDQHQQQDESTDRPISQASTYSTASSISPANSNATTVVTRKASGGKRTATTSKVIAAAVTTATSVTTNATTAKTSRKAANPGGPKGKASALKGNGVKKATTNTSNGTGTGTGTRVSKKVVVAEPAAGKRVLRKRN